MKYIQCVLRKEYKEGAIFQTTLLPAKFAVVDMMLRLKNERDEWENGWKVVFIGSSINEAVDYRRAIREHRKSTGDSLRKVEN